jgi:predicted nucleotidyltransferase component of viral defense system
MKQTDYKPIALLHKDPDLFRTVVNFTSAETLFIPRLLEKDYFCTLLLHYLSATDETLVFKGGTCLAKVYAGFYRLSEDLDFVISASADSLRSVRSRKMATAKKAISCIADKLGAFRLVQPLTGANNSTQYIAVVGYSSLLGKTEETIKIEIGLREPLLTPSFHGLVTTILLNPITGKSMIQTFPMTCISYNEGMAEKFRAALSRREPAIRDFYDIHYAISHLNLNSGDASFLDLIKKKLAVPGNNPVDVSKERLSAIRRQLDAELKPVLRNLDYAAFDLEQAFQVVIDVTNRLEQSHVAK